MHDRQSRRGVDMRLLLTAALVLAVLALMSRGAVFAGMFEPVDDRVVTLSSSLLSLLRRSVAPDDGSVEKLTLRLPGAGAPVTVDIWHARVTPEPTADAAAMAPALLIYTPGSGQRRTDNAATAAELARHGYVVAALDDIEQAPEAVDVTPLRFDFASERAYATTLREADAKTLRQAERLIEVLDRLSILQRQAQAPAWLAGLPLDRAGAFGWSLGGSTAAEAGVLDRRIVAVANLDGWLFGAAAAGSLEAPYLLALSDYPFPADSDLDDPDPARRYEARLTRRDLEEERRLIGRPGSVGVRLSRAIHENLSDLALDARFWRSWSRVDPVRAKGLVDACLAAFFDHHLRGAPSSGCLDESYAVDGVQRFRTIEWPGAATATAPE